MAEFVHIHNHSDFSLLDGASPIKGMIARAVAHGSPALALTDHGNMHGALEFYHACRTAGIKPIVGCELYFAPKSIHDKGRGSGSENYYHFLALAKDYQGYKNLLKLSSRGYTEGFYYKPRIDLELLEEHRQGLICTSACIGGEIPQLILSGNRTAAQKKIHLFQEVLGKDNFFLEIQDHSIADEQRVNRELVELSGQTGAPLVASNDSHYLTGDDAEAHDILLCIGTGKLQSDTRRMKFDSNQLYIKSPEEMEALFGEIPESLSNTLRIAEMCNLEIELPGPLLPTFEIPEGYASSAAYLEYLVFEGLKRRYSPLSDSLRTRATYELDVITSMNFTDYFLIVWDYIHWAKERGIAVGPGRGSGTGSIVAYALQITDIDPIKHNLIFERFLNPERVSMPDFDIDFCFERRQEVIDYIFAKYGKNKVAQICTFGTLKARSVVRDVARVLDIPYAEADSIAKLIPEGPGTTLDEAVSGKGKLNSLISEGGEKKKLLDVAMRLEGLSRHVSTHAAGLVIGQEELTNYVPIFQDTKTGSLTTQYTMNYLEDAGLVKMDLLGLKTLTLLGNAERLIKSRQPEFSCDEIPEGDKATYKMLSEGRSTCIFQFESSGMQEILQRTKPTCFEDLVALNALYRPGPMHYIPQFISCKNGTTPISYPHPSLEEILKPTYGVIVYQEQVMKVAEVVAGFSLAKADILRRAMGKKKVEDMERMKGEFIAGALERGYTAELAKNIFETLAPFAGYGFNKSHSAAYALLAYKTAYLKANHPAEFMAANLSNEISNTTKLSEYIDESKGMGIDLLPPAINLSQRNFSVSDGKIVYGLVGIKNVGGAAVDEILSVRERGGEFASLAEFLERVDLKIVNRRIVETLVQSGVFDRLGHNRATLFDNLDSLISHAISANEHSAQGQALLFNDPSDQVFAPPDLTPIEEWAPETLLSFEETHLGFYFSGHPLDQFQEILEQRTTLSLKALESAQTRRPYYFLGMIKSLKEISTKAGKPMAFAQLDDRSGSAELVLFSKVWETYREKLAKGSIVAISGSVDKSRGEPKILVDKILPPEELPKPKPKELHIRLNPMFCSEPSLEELRDFLMERTGELPVVFHLTIDEGEMVVQASNIVRCNTEDRTLEDVRAHPEVVEAWQE